MKKRFIILLFSLASACFAHAQAYENIYGHFQFEYLKLSGLFQPPIYATAGRPGAIGAYQFIFNTDLGLLQYSNGVTWQTINQINLAATTLKTTTYTATTFDYNIECTGTWTLTLPALSGGGAWNVFNNGTGIITIDPNASETITVGGISALTYTLNPGDAITISPRSATGWFASSFSAAGTYTPTVTNSGNATGTIAPQVSHWHRDGNQVTVDGIFTLSAVTSAVTTAVEITLPYASTITLFTDIEGLATINGTTTNWVSGFIQGDNSSHLALLEWLPLNTGTSAIYFHFVYTIK